MVLESTAGRRTSTPAAADRVASSPVRRLDDGSTEEAGWFQVDGERVYHVTRVPGRPVRAWMVLCPSIGGEFDGGYRRQTLLGRQLTDLGVASIRLHYRGTGNSDLGRLPERATMAADAVAAARLMADRFPGVASFILGERLGALVAAETAVDVGASGLLLWQPVIEVDAYRRELARATKLQEVATNETPVDFGADYDEGRVDLVGFPIDRHSIESFAGRTLSDIWPGPGCRVDLFQFGRKRLDPRYVRLVDDWQERGAALSTHLLEQPELWWFAPGQWIHGEELRPVTMEALQVTVEAMGRRLEQAQSNESSGGEPT